MHAFFSASLLASQMRSQNEHTCHEAACSSNHSSTTGLLKPLANPTTTLLTQFPATPDAEIVTTDPNYHRVAINVARHFRITQSPGARTIRERILS